MKNSNSDVILERTARFFSEKLGAHGATPRGLDYNSEQAMLIRYAQIFKICEGRNDMPPFSINDVGCGYGAFYKYMKDRGLDFVYHGYDVSSDMINEARKINADGDDCFFHYGDEKKIRCDFTVAISIFNIKTVTDDKAWLEYMLSVLREMNEISEKGMAFDCLTQYSDKEKMREDLYYADPLFLFDYCKRNFSRNVALLHDYELYDFTILVRK